MKKKHPIAKSFIKAIDGLNEYESALKAAPDEWRYGPKGREALLLFGEVWKLLDKISDLDVEAMVLKSTTNVKRAKLERTEPKEDYRGETADGTRT